MEPTVVDVARDAIPLLYAWITLGVLALIFFPPLAFKLAGRGGDGPLWLYLLLGLGVPALGFGLAWGGKRWACHDFDRVEVRGEQVAFVHSFTGARAEVQRAQVAGIERRLIETATMEGENGYALVVHLVGGRELVSDESIAMRLDKAEAALVEALGLAARTRPGEEP